MTKPRIIQFVGAKHGAGTTTAVALYAIQYASPTKLVTAVDNTLDPGDLEVMLGLDGPGSPIRGTPGLRTFAPVRDGFSSLGDDSELILIDSGVEPAPLLGPPGWPDAERLLVVTNSYMVLRRAQRMVAAESFDSLVLIDHPGSALDIRDVEAVLGLTAVTRIPWSSTISRSIDAGMLALRLPKDATQALARLK